MIMGGWDYLTGKAKRTAAKNANSNIVNYKEVIFDKVLWRFRQYRGMTQAGQIRYYLSAPCEYYEDATTVDSIEDYILTVDQWDARVVKIDDISKFPYAEVDEELSRKFPKHAPVWRVKDNVVVNGKKVSSDQSPLS